MNWGKQVPEFHKTNRMAAYRGMTWVRWSCWFWVGLLSAPLAAPLLTSPALAQASGSLQEAQRLVNQGLVNQAIAILEPIVRRNPTSVEAQLALAMAYQKAGNYTNTNNAFAAYQRVIQLDPTNRAGLLGLGIMGGYRVKWQEQGIAALSTLLEQHPDDAEARAQRALLRSYQGNLPAAIADYEIALQQNPTPDVVLGAAQAYAYVGEYEKGLELFSRYRATGRSIEGSPATAYSIALRETGDPASAVQVLEPELYKQSGINGTTIRMRAALAVAYAANGQDNQALSVLTPLEGRFDSRMILARTLHQMSPYTSDPAFTQMVVDLAQRVLTQPSTNPYVTVTVARELADILSGMPSQQAYAREIYRQLLEQDPHDRSVQIQLAVLERQMGIISRTELQQRLQPALEPMPPDTFQRKLLAQALTRLDMPDPELLPYFQSFITAQVDEPLLYFRTAQIYIQRNDLMAARQALETYSLKANRRQDQLSKQLLLAEIDRREGNLEASARKYEAVISSNPPDQGILNGALQGLAGIRRVQGRLPESIALYDQIIALNPQDTAKPLGRASLAYQAGLLSQPQAEAILYNWLTTQPNAGTPPELYSLVAALPADPQRAPLYDALLAANPDNVPLQLRRLQLIASRNPAQARAQIARLIAQDPDNLGTYFVQGQIGQDIGDLDLASDAYEKILQENINNTDALSALGGIRFQQRRFDSATELYHQVLELEPDNRVAQTALISLTAIQGRRLEALQQLEQLQQGNGATDPDLPRQIQQVQEGFLQQRGFQPPWERY